MLDCASPVHFAPLAPEDFVTIERQPSQHRLLGAEIDEVTDDEACALASQPFALTAFHRGRIVALFGVAEQFAGKHGVAWAVLARGIGPAHLAVTRRAREEIAASGLNRIELIAKAAQTPFGLRRAIEAGRPADLAFALDAQRISAECRWALMLGFDAAHVLHGYGAGCETHVLFEWFPR